MENAHQKISITSLLYKHSPKLLVFSIIIGAAAGALYSLIIPFVLQGIEKQKSAAPVIESINSPVVFNTLVNFMSQHVALAFFSVVFLILCTKATSVILFNNISKSAAVDLRIRIAKKINSMKIDQIESIGFPRLQNVMNGDVNNVLNAAMAIPMIVVSAVTVIGMLGYLAFLNFYICLIVLAGIFLGVFIFQVPVSMAAGLYEKSRRLQDIVQEGVRGLIVGSYELRLSQPKSQAFVAEELIQPQRQGLRMEKIGDAVMHLAGTSSDLLSFFIIGFLVFVLPGYLSFPANDSLGIVMALLYIAGPVAVILGSLQAIQVGRVALVRIQELDAYEDEDIVNKDTNQFTEWQYYILDNVDYVYRETGVDHPFSLHPISVSFQRGQVNFIVGGNGSGKSTLSKLISLHYQPRNGAVRFDNQIINNTNLVSARSRISVIFSNYYLFGKLYRDYSHQDEQRINRYLDALDLSGKTQFINGQFSTVKLSDGQRRRLALLVSLLEDKDIYIFDEWAADQDPVFKNLFYTEILPDMKRDKKLVIVITHDDRYFNCADRIIFMENGKLVDIKNNATDTCSTIKETDYNPFFNRKVSV